MKLCETSFSCPGCLTIKPEVELESDEEMRVNKENNAHSKFDNLMTDDGQKEFLKMMKEQEENPESRKSLSVMTVKPGSTAGLSTVEPGQWIRIDLTVDKGACDSVMPKEGPWAGIQIVPSEMSKTQEEYEVANAASIPNLGERHLATWTEGSSRPKSLCMQVADMHKPLLSLGRCADLGFESRFGKQAGALVDKQWRSHTVAQGRKSVHATCMDQSCS